MSSPNLNNSVLLGCTLSYISVFLFGLDGGFISSGYEMICVSRAWTLSLGFSLAYGAMFSKTWRVHLIFTNKKLKRKVVKDRHLFAVVCLLVTADVIYLTVWQLMDPMTRIVREFVKQSLDSDLDITLVKQLELCESRLTYRWLGVLCGYKGLLLLFGAFLAWETRNVSIPALNDSKYAVHQEVHWYVCVQRVYPVRYWCADIIGHEGRTRCFVFYYLCLHYHLYLYYSVSCVHTEGARNETC